MKISIFGLGYVGAVSLACLARDGHQVIGVDIDKTKLELIQAGKTPVVEEGMVALMQQVAASGRVSVTTDARAAVRDSQISLVCVGTPSAANGSQDQGAILRLAAQLGQALARKLGKDSGMGLLQANSYGAVPQLLLATVLLESGQIEALTTATPLHWTMLAFVAIVGFYAAYVAFYSVLSECRMDEVAPFILLMPLISVLTAWALLGETVSLAQAAGGLVIIAGLGVITGLDRLITGATRGQAAAGR